MTDAQDNEFQVGDEVTMRLMGRARRSARITNIAVNPRNGEMTAYLDNHLTFTAADVERNWVERPR